MSVGSTYPVRVGATLDSHLSRWLWLVKWLLVIPHYVVLFFLWIAFVVVSVGAFFAILFTGRYPLSLFEFNVGVLRWSWRVAYYSYGALATDRYPPFTLAEVADYPAHLEIDYPQHLSRGLVLVKWWLLAIPQYLIVAVFAGGGAWAAWQTDRNTAGWGGGLIGLLVLIAAITLTFTGRYPRQIFDFVLGLNRWVLRVAAYAGLMTDRYPPFRLDMGGTETGGTMAMPPPGGPPAAAPPATWATSPPPPPPPPPTGWGAPPARKGWTGPRIASLVVGCILMVVSVGMLATGGVATWLDNTQRDAAGYLTSNPHTFVTSGYAITSDRIDLGTSDIAAPSAILGTVRLRVTASSPGQDIFIGIASRTSVESYLAGVPHAVVSHWANGKASQPQASGLPPSRPADVPIWVASVAGTGTQTLTWKPSSGQWLIVVMNPDASRGVSIMADVGATVPSLGWIAGGLFAGGGLLLIAGVLLIVIPVTAASRRPPAGAAQTPLPGSAGR